MTAPASGLFLFLPLKVPDGLVCRDCRLAVCGLRGCHRGRWRADPAAGAVCDLSQCGAGHLAGHQQVGLGVGHKLCHLALCAPRDAAVAGHAAGCRCRLCRLLGGCLGRHHGVARVAAQGAAAGADRHPALHAGTQGSGHAPSAALGRAQRDPGGQPDRAGAGHLRWLLRAGYRQLSGIPAGAGAGL